MFPSPARHDYPFAPLPPVAGFCIHVAASNNKLKRHPVKEMNRNRPKSAFLAGKTPRLLDVQSPSPPAAWQRFAGRTIATRRAFSLEAVSNDPKQKQNQTNLYSFAFGRYLRIMTCAVLLDLDG